MPIPARAELPRTEDEYEFEQMVRDALAVRWNWPDTQRNGRRGQRQHGVDVYGSPPDFGGCYFVAQCKNHFRKTPTVQLVEAEAREAESFSDAIARMYFATATSRDATVQQMLRDLSEKRARSGKWPVYPLFWEDIRDELCKDSTLVRKYWGQFAPETEPERVALQDALVIEDLVHEVDPEGLTTLVRLGVRNVHRHRTIENVCVRVMSLTSLTGNNDQERLPFARPLLAISETGRMPSNPPETFRNLAASDVMFFNFMHVRSHRKNGHCLCYGECVKNRPFVHEGSERWTLAYTSYLAPGRYRIIVEAQGKDVASVRRRFVFWGDKSGRHCVDANDPSAQCTDPLEFALIDLDTLPPDMQPHQCRVLAVEISKAEYDGMTPEATYLKIDGHPTMCGLAEVLFYPSGDLAGLPAHFRQRAVGVSDEERAALPGGIPGFPNAIRRSDFEIVWNAVRGGRRSQDV